MEGITSNQNALAGIKRPTKGVIVARQFVGLIDAISGGQVGQQGSVPRGARPVTTIIGKVDGSEPDGDTNRFFYGAYEVHLTGRGYGKWSQVKDGFTADAADEKTRIYHYVESVNTSGGVTGSGINPASFPNDTWAVSAVPDGTLIAIDFYSIRENGQPSVVGWFYVLGTQGADGTC